MGTTESSLYHDGSSSTTSSLQQDDARRLHARSSPASVASHPRRPIKRSPRPPVVVPVMTLNGFVLGLTGSGKRTLLQRLEGKDPFVDTATANSDEDSPKEITVPYQPPSNATVWDRIQLHVELTPNEHNVPADFCVILVNPRHDAKRLRPYIAKLVSMWIKQQQSQQRPLCLCFLLNFRDLQGDRYNRIQCHDVEKWAMEIIQQHDNDDDDSERRVVVQCTATSLKNCYGLSSLHHFIYRVYLLHKQVELQQRLAQVQTAVKETEKVPSMPYESFLQVLKEAETATATTTESSSEKQQVNDESETLDKSGESRRQRDRQRKSKSESDRERREAQASITDSDSRQQEGDRKSKKQTISEVGRSILPKTYTDPKQTLDAFFADDDDEEEDIVTPVTSHHGKHKHYHSDKDDDDDEDDDFFYDEGGHRHQHGDIVTDSSSSDEEASIDSQLAHVREHSIIDSEEESAEGETSNTMKLAVNGGDSGANDEAGRDSENHVDDAHKQVAEDGWDDEIDLDDDDDDDKESAGAVNSDGSNHTEEKEQVSENRDDDGWDDEDDLDLESDTELETDAASPNGTRLSGTADTAENVDADHLDRNDTDKEAVSHSKDSEGESQQQVLDKRTESPADEAKAAQGTDDDEQLVPKETAPPHDDETGQDATAKAASDGNAEQETAKVPAKPALARTAMPPPAQEDSSDDDDDFIVEDVSAQQSESVTTKQPATVAEKAPEPPVASTPPQPLSSSGISAAALAAIAAAEKEAQLMIQEQSKVEKSRPKVEKKKSKKKKDPDAKKKKKKHKEKQSSKDD